MIRPILLGAALLGIFSEGALAAEAAMIVDGKKVTLTYQLSVNGTLLEEAQLKEPFTYLHGKNQIVPGLEKGLSGLRAGEQKRIRVPPEEAYGPVDPKAFQEIPKGKLPPGVQAVKGTLLEARSPEGLEQLVKIVEVKEKSVVIDFNHPLAGKELDFDVTVLRVE